MSAFIVGTDHIDALLTAAMAWSDGGRFSFYRLDSETDELTKFDLTADTASLVGALLLLENQRSVNFRYDDDDLEPVYEFRALPWKFGKRPDPVVVLKAIDCYVYQSCEHDGWPESTAKRFCVTLQGLMIANLPGYNAAPSWEVRDRNLFEAGR